MAKVKNITPDTLSLWRADAPPIDPGDEVELRDENFVDRAWPKTTWELVEAPELDGYVDMSTEDAWLFTEPDPEPEAEPDEVEVPDDQDDEDPDAGGEPDVNDELEEN